MNIETQKNIVLVLKELQRIVLDLNGGCWNPNDETKKALDASSDIINNLSPRTVDGIKLPYEIELVAGYRMNSNGNTLTVYKIYVDGEWQTTIEDYIYGDQYVFDSIKWLKNNGKLPVSAGNSTREIRDVLGVSLKYSSRHFPRLKDLKQFASYK